MGKYINPFTDLGFKKLFGQEVNKELLIEFLNDLLVGERRVEDITFMDKESQPETMEGRMAAFDILCREKDGTLFFVEMQNGYQSYFFDRGLFYLCRMISNQGQQGKDWKFAIYPVYGIYFLNFQLSELSKLRTDVILADRETGRQIDGKLRQIYLSLPHFTLEAEECKTDFERWIYLLKNMETLDRMPFEAKKAAFRKLLDVGEIEKLSPVERQLYDERLKHYRDYVNTVESAEEKGIKKGRIEGEADKACRIATSMKKDGFPTETIAKYTGLSVEEINRLVITD